MLIWIFHGAIAEAFISQNQNASISSLFRSKLWIKINRIYFYVKFIANLFIGLHFRSYLLLFWFDKISFHHATFHVSEDFFQFFIKTSFIMQIIYYSFLTFLRHSYVAPRLYCRHLNASTARGDGILQHISTNSDCSRDWQSTRFSYCNHPTDNHPKCT